MDLIRELNRTLEMTVIMVTHERPLAERYANRLVFLGDGKLVGELENTKASTPASQPIPSAKNAEEMGPAKAALSASAKTAQSGSPGSGDPGVKKIGAGR